MFTCNFGWNTCTLDICNHDVKSVYAYVCLTCQAFLRIEIQSHGSV